VEKVAGLLEVWRPDDGHKIVIKYPDLKPDANGMGNIVLSLRHARHLGNVLIMLADEAETDGSAFNGEKGRADVAKDRNVAASDELNTTSELSPEFHFD
jgi:hypothetical protein